MRLDNEPLLKRVTIYVEDNGWMLEHKDDPCAATVLELFGTTALPMPFVLPTPESLVRCALERRNPGIVITRGPSRITKKGWK